MTETIWTPDRVAERRHDKWLKEKLSTPEGHMQDCLERTLPQSVVADARKREMWAVHPDVAASAAVFDAVLLLVQARYLAIRDGAGAKSFGRWFSPRRLRLRSLTHGAGSSLGRRRRASTSPTNSVLRLSPGLSQKRGAQAPLHPQCPAVRLSNLQRERH